MFSLLALLGVLPLPLAGITLLGSCSSSSTASPSYSNNVTWLWHVEHRNTTIGMAAWQARTAIHVTILEDVSRSKKDPTTTDLADGLLKEAILVYAGEWSGDHMAARGLCSKAP